MLPQKESCESRETWGCLSYPEAGHPRSRPLIPMCRRCSPSVGLLLKQVPAWWEGAETLGPTLPFDPIVQINHTCPLTEASDTDWAPSCPLLCSPSALGCPGKALGP